ncbi:MAG: mechanosensitive ion channel family protein [Halobacteriota archaeon]
MSDAIEQTIGEVIGYLPTILAVLVLLLVGYVFGRILGGLVSRIVRRIGIDRYAEGTAMEEMGSGDGIAYGLGKIVSYYVYFVTILAAADLLGISQLTGLLSELGAALPVILGALVVLVIGFIAGRVVGDIVSRVVGSFGIGAYLRETPLERLGDTEGEFGRIVGQLVTYYIYLVTLLAVADILAITALSELLNMFAGYLPALIGGLLVLLVGIWVAERVGAIVKGMDDGRMINAASLVVKLLIYYITITIALSTIGFDVAVLTSLFTTFVVAFLGTLALALAIGIGLAVGFGGQDYVAENIDGWVASMRGTVVEDDTTELE